MIRHSIIVLGVVLAYLARQSAGADDTWLARPYHVRIAVNPPNRAIESAVERALGSACRFTEPADKSLDFSVRHDGSDFQLSVQETDLWMHEAGPVIERSVLADELLPATAARLAKLAFRPRALITRSDERFTASVWGGRLDGTLLENTRWYRPFIRFQDREGEWRETTAIAWTYLMFNSGDRLGKEIVVESALPQPLPGRIRRGDVIALAAPIVTDKTQIQLVDAQSNRVRSGLTVEAAIISDGANDPDDDSATAPSNAEKIRTLTADTRGNFVIESEPRDSELLTLTVRTTTAIAQVPVLPGELATVVIPLRNDIERVELKERLEAIEYDLKELIARRSILVSKVRADVEAKRWNAANATLLKLDELPDVSSLLGALNAARVAAVDSALARGDRTLASRLRRTAARLERTITSLDEPMLTDEFRDEMRTLQEIDAAAKRLEADTES